MKVWMYGDSYRAWPADIIERTEDRIVITFKRTQYQENIGDIKFGCWPDKSFYLGTDGRWSDARENYLFFSWEEFRTFYRKKLKKDIEEYKNRIKDFKKSINRCKCDLVIIDYEEDETYPMSEEQCEKYPAIVEAVSKYL